MPKSVTMTHRLDSSQMNDATSSSRIPHAVLWDMDGTLIDSEPYWVAAEIDMVKRFGGTWTHNDGLQLVGKGLPYSAGVLQDAGVRLTSEQIIDELTDHVIDLLRDAVPWRPGAVALISAIASAGIPQGIVTMSISRMAQLVAELIPDNPMRVVVSGDEVQESKPHPQPYLVGAERLGVDITRCVAFEDSMSGIESAHTAGTVTIGLPNLVDISSSPAHALWESLPERSLSDLLDVFGQVRGALA